MAFSSPRHATRDGTGQEDTHTTPLTTPTPDETSGSRCTRHPSTVPLTHAARASRPVCGVPRPGTLSQQVVTGAFRYVTCWDRCSRYIVQAMHPQPKLQ
jgi:hypothetical protein